MQQSNNSLENMSYKQASHRLNEILDSITSEELEIDHLSDLVKESTALVKLCKKKLRDAEKNVEKNIEELENNIEEL